MGTLFLKIKIMSLAAEASIIRREERKAYDNHAARKRLRRSNARGRQHTVGDRVLFLELKRHRRHVVREEARASQLAYGFLRGRTYHQLERKAYLPPDWAKVESMVSRFGGVSKDDARNRLKEWSRDEE
jgi:hypothetical protein